MSRPCCICRKREKDDSMKSTSWLLLFIQTGEAARVRKPAAVSSSWFPPMFLQGEEQELLSCMLTASHSGRQSVRPQKKQWNCGRRQAALR
jgi:hypothetical protein